MSAEGSEPVLFAETRGAVSAHLNEERLRLRAEAREFTMGTVLPLANELDPQHVDLPQDLLDELAARGYFGILVPQEFGGLGLGVFEYCMISEELARGWMSVPSVLARGNAMGTDFADAARREELLRRSAAGEWIAASAFSEPEAGSDLAAVQCRAEQEGERWVINGEKRWCGLAKAADFILLLARTGPHPHKGLEWFVLEKPRGELPAGVTGTPIPKIGYFGITTWALTLKDVEVPLSARVDGSGSGDADGQGFYDTVRLMNIARVHTAARAVGLAQGALEEAAEYARKRVQFGRPLSAQQVIRFKLATMATEVAAARALYFEAADLLDRGVRCEETCAMAKLFASEMAERVTSEALQIHGGNGYTTEFAVERHWRDARLTKIFEGTSEIQQLLIARRMMGREP